MMCAYYDQEQNNYGFTPVDFQYDSTSDPLRSADIMTPADEVGGYDDFFMDEVFTSFEDPTL